MLPVMNNNKLELVWHSHAKIQLKTHLFAISNKTTDN